MTKRIIVAVLVSCAGFFLLGGIAGFAVGQNHPKDQPRVETKTVYRHAGPAARPHPGAILMLQGRELSEAEWRVVDDHVRESNRRSGGG